MTTTTKPAAELIGDPAARAIDEDIFKEALLDLNRGRPRKFIELLFYVTEQPPSEDDVVDYADSFDTEDSGVDASLTVETGIAGTVPFAYKPNQVYYDEQVFNDIVLPSLRRALRVLVVKDRKALSTTFWMAVGTAYFFTQKNFDLLVIADLDETANFIMSMTDTFYNSLPLDMRPRKKHWKRERFRELSFGYLLHPDLPETGEDGSNPWIETGTSSITVSSVKTPSFGRARTPKMVILSEMAHYPAAVEAELMKSLKGSFGRGIWLIMESTCNGYNNGFRRNFEAIERGDIAGLVLFRSWFQNPYNQLSMTAAETRPADRIPDSDIIIGDAGGLLGESEEIELAKQLPEPKACYIRRRRAWIAENIVDQAGDPRAGYSAFLQEHAEDKSTCWIRVANPQFDVNIIHSLESHAKEPIMDTNIGGMRWRMWRKPVNGGIYVCGMDFGTGEASDFTDAAFLDVQDGCFVAELHGKIGVYESIQIVTQLLWLYNEALFGPELNGLGSDAVKQARDAGYSNFWKRKRKLTEKITSISWLKRQAGWSTVGGINQTRSRMINGLQAGVNNGSIWTQNQDLIRDWQSYNPDLDKKLHLPDRFAASAIAIQIAPDAAIMTPGRQNSPAPKSRGGNGVTVIPGGRVGLHGGFRGM